MHEVERVPEPQIARGIRANREYRERYLDRITQACAEELITSEELTARMAPAYREGVTTDELRRLTVDLPEQVTVVWPPAKARVVLYIAAGVACLAFAICSPLTIATIAGAHANLGEVLGEVITCLIGIMAVIVTVFIAGSDQVIKAWARS